MNSKYYVLNVRKFDRGLVRALKVRAAELDRTLSGVVEEACRLWLAGVVQYEDLQGSGAAPTRDDGFARTAESGRSLKSAGVVSGDRRGDSRPSTSGHVGVAQSGVQSTVTASTQSGPQSKDSGSAESESPTYRARRTRVSVAAPAKTEPGSAGVEGESREATPAAKDARVDGLGNLLTSHPAGCKCRFHKMGLTKNEVTGIER